MICSVSKSGISGTVRCPPSKSYTHRAIFLASLAGGSRVTNALISADTESTVAACRRFGAEVSVDGGTVTVGRGIDTSSAAPPVDAGNSGTTIRMASAIAALLPGRTELSGDESLRRRPMQPLLDALESMGASCDSDGGRPPVGIAGRMQGGAVSIPGGVSSQFVSALMVSAPATARGMEITVTGGAVSRPYIDATAAAMGAFGARADAAEPYARYSIPPQGYAGADFEVPADASSLALLLAAAAVSGGGVRIGCRTGGLPQGDLAFIRMLEGMGAEISQDADGITAGPARPLRGGRFDLGDTPDLLPPLAALVLNSEGPIEIANAGHARLKETDRIAMVCREMAKLGVRVREAPDGMVLGPPREPVPADLDAAGDHRLFMAFCIAGMAVGGCTVSGAESAGVSYPGFVSQMGALGAGISDPRDEL